MGTNVKNEAYGFKIGEIVELKIALSDERDVLVEKGSRLRIVAIAPKIYEPRKEIADDVGVDMKQYFYNAVRADQESDYGNRIRSNFCTIQRIK